MQHQGPAPLLSGWSAGPPGAKARVRTRPATQGPWPSKPAAQSAVH